MKISCHCSSMLEVDLWNASQLLYRVPRFLISPDTYTCRASSFLEELLGVLQTRGTVEGFSRLFWKQTFRGLKTMQTLQYIYILLKKQLLNVTETSGWLDNDWINLFGVNFFHSPHRLYLLRGLRTLSLLLLPAERQNQWGRGTCFSPDMKRPTTKGWRV